jgi:hypothetical protein
MINDYITFYNLTADRIVVQVEYNLPLIGQEKRRRITNSEHDQYSKINPDIYFGWPCEIGGGYFVWLWLRATNHFRSGQSG